jgi:uncharacterized protein (DUF2147 family)
VDDVTGEVKSIVEIYKRDEIVFEKVLEIINKEHKNELCTKFEGADKNEAIEGLVIIKNLEKDGDKYNDGTVMGLDNGNKY